MDASNSDAHGTASATKRVVRACHHCRQKRVSVFPPGLITQCLGFKCVLTSEFVAVLQLKCTTAQYPCPNCQLYGAECVYPTDTTASRRRRNGGPGGRQRPPPRAASIPPEPPTPGSVLNRLDPTIPVHQHDADNSLDGILPQGGAPASDDLMDFWNETLDLSCAVVFEGLQPSPSSTTKGPASQVSSSRRGNREAGGKVSGVESLAVGDGRGEPSERILPGLFIRKDTPSPLRWSDHRLLHEGVPQKHPWPLGLCRSGFPHGGWRVESTSTKPGFLKARWPVSVLTSCQTSLLLAPRLKVSLATKSAAL